MARYRDNSGIDNTCPKIDRVISLIDSFDPEDEAVISDLQDALILMQEIREANANLREWGNEQYDSFYEIEKERDSLSVRGFAFVGDFQH